MGGLRAGGWWRVLVGAGALVVALFPGRQAVAAGPADDGARPGDPALSVDPAAVHSAMACRGPAGGSGRSSVLLVHGTGFGGDESFGWSYLPELAARGYRVCIVDLPNRSLADIQVAAEYVVVAVHRLARESGRKVDVLSHSQGALQARWAVRWWPSVQAQVDDLVTLAGPNQGTTTPVAPLVGAVSCPACLQMKPTSSFIAALNRGDQSPGAVSYTSIYSTLVDELITPNVTAPRIEGGSNIPVQSLCQGRVVTHVSILSDAVAFAVALDALNRPGPASPARFDRNGCLHLSYIGVPGTMGGLETLLSPHTLPSYSQNPGVEPAVKPYAQPQAAGAAAPAPVKPAATARASTNATASAIAGVAAARPAASSASASARVDAAAAHRAAPAAAPERPVATDLHPAPISDTGRGDGRRWPLTLVAGVALLTVAGAVAGATVSRARSGV